MRKMQGARQQASRAMAHLDGQPQWRTSMSTLELTKSSVDRQLVSPLRRCVAGIQVTRWVVFASPLALVGLACLVGFLAVLEDRAFVVAHLYAKAVFAAFLYARARLLFAAIGRRTGNAGRANEAAVVAMLGLATVLLAKRDARRLVYAGSATVPFAVYELTALVDAHGLARAAAGAAYVLVDVGVVVLALRLYAAPLADAVGVASTAGLAEETEAYRGALERHCFLCALSLVASCWSWCAFVFAPIPAACLTASLLWWRLFLRRTRRAADVALEAPAARSPCRSLCVFVGLALVGVGGPAGVLFVARGRTLRGRAGFAVFDVAAHALLCLLLIRSSKTLPRDRAPRRPNSPTAAAAVMRMPSRNAGMTVL